MIPAFWWGDEKSFDLRERNWGDLITPLILKGLTGQDAMRTTRGSSRVLAVGSILHRAHPGDFIWGAGIISPNHVPTCAASLKVSAVRGPHTRDLLLAAGASVPEIYGDPALLAPFFFDLSDIPKTHELGIIPHYNDVDAVKHLASPDVKIIDICAGVDEVLRQVAACQTILASSLHGIVLGDCFAGKVAWLRVGGGAKLVGKSFKFADYLLGTGRCPEATDMKPGDTMPNIHWLPKPQIDLETLAAACPYRNTVSLSQISKRALGLK